MVASTRAGSRIGVRSTNSTPSAKAGSRSAATWRARRVLPMPPGPVSVRRRTAGASSSWHTAATSRARPISGVSGRGSVPRGRASGVGADSMRGLVALATTAAAGSASMTASRWSRGTSARATRTKVRCAAGDRSSSSAKRRAIAVEGRRSSDSSLRSVPKATPRRRASASWVRWRALRRALTQAPNDTRSSNRSISPVKLG